MWVRGLKLPIETTYPCISESHPVWVRGLKHRIDLVFYTLIIVAPRVGAWIETTMTEDHVSTCNVAPRVGAWIETTTFSVPVQ